MFFFRSFEDNEHCQDYQERSFQIMWKIGEGGSQQWHRIYWWLFICKVPCHDYNLIAFFITINWSGRLSVLSRLLQNLSMEEPPSSQPYSNWEHWHGGILRLRIANGFNSINCQNHCNLCLSILPVLTGSGTWRRLEESWGQRFCQLPTFVSSIFAKVTGTN